MAAMNKLILFALIIFSIGLVGGSLVTTTGHFGNFLIKNWNNSENVSLVQLNGSNTGTLYLKLPVLANITETRINITINNSIRGFYVDVGNDGTFDYQYLDSFYEFNASRFFPLNSSEGTVVEDALLKEDALAVNTEDADWIINGSDGHALSLNEGSANEYIKTNWGAGDFWSCGNWSIAFWFNTTDTGDNRKLFGRRTATGDAALVLGKEGANDHLYFEAGDGDNGANRIEFRFANIWAAQIATGTWNHMVVTKQTGCAGLSLIEIYLNGVNLTGRVQVTSGTMSDYTMTGDLWFGAENSGGNNLNDMNVDFDDILIYSNITLDQTKVTSLYTRSTTGLNKDLNGSFIMSSIGVNISNALKSCNHDNKGFCYIPLVFGSNTSRNFTADISGTLNYSLPYNMTYENSTLEGVVNTYKFYTFTNETLRAVLNHNFTNYSSSFSKNNFSWIFTTNLIPEQVPDGLLNYSVSLYWLINMTGETYNTSKGNQTVFTIGLDKCTSFASNFMNFTVYDEQTKLYDGLINVSIETDINLTYLNFTWNFNTTVNGSGKVVLPLCFSGEAAAFNNFSLGLITRYKANAHAVEFYYLQNYDLLNNTFQDISLYTLNTDTTKEEYSTSFLINYEDRNYIPVSGVIIDLLRYYVGDGIYLSVEHGQTDVSGNTRLHMVTEDIKYRAIVRKNGVVLYESDPFLAICQATPCQINLQEEDELNDVWNYTEEGNLQYQITLNEKTRTATVNYATIDGSTTTANLRVTRFDAYLNQTICNENLTSSTGTIICTIPETARNNTYLVEFSTYNSPANWVTSRYFDLNTDAINIFGTTGIIMSFFLVLTLTLMAVSSGIVAVILFGIVGIIFASLLAIFSGGAIFGIGSAVLWLIVAGGIIIWKVSSR